MAHVGTLASDSTDFVSAVASTAFPGVFLKSLFDSEADATKFYGTNGTYISVDSGDSSTLTDIGGSEATIGIADTTGILVGMFVYVDDVSAGTNTVGYYEITGVTTDTLITIDVAPLDGSLGIGANDTVSYYIGGVSSAFDDTTSLQNLFDLIGPDVGATTGNAINSLEILCTTSTGLTMTAPLDLDNIAGSAASQVIITGTDSNFDRAIDITDMPVLDMGLFILNIAGDMLRFRNINVTGISTSLMTSVTGSRCIIEQCKFTQSSNNANADAALGVSGSGCIVRGNHIVSTVPGTAVTSAALLYSGARGVVLNNFVDTQQAGITVTASNSTPLVSGNIVTGNNTNIGISITEGNATRGYYCSDNSIHNFKTGINIPVGTDDGDVGIIHILNNIIWAGDIADSEGIANADVASSIYYYVDNNAIGNADTPYEFGDLTIENKIALTANPFTNAGTSFALASDFKLNETAGGGALCRSAAKPNDFDSDGTQDSWGDVGALQAEPTGGAGGGVMPLTGLFS